MKKIVEILRGVFWIPAPRVKRKRFSCIIINGEITDRKDF